MTYRLPALNGLKAFEAAARNLSFKTAASELGVTPGAVSQLVRKLESSLGVMLFRRLPQGLLLTAEGEAYFPRIAEAFELLTEATESIAPDLNSRKFSVGICPEVYKLLPQGWSRCTEAARGCIREAICSADIELIWTRQLDCIVDIHSRPRRELGIRPIHSVANGHDVVLIAMKGMINCRQTDEIIASVKQVLEAWTTKSPS